MQILSTEDKQGAKILLVEDTDADVQLTLRAFKKADFPVNLYHVDSGQKCLDYLRKQGEFGEAPDIDIVLLDLHMPIMTGHDVLQQIAADDSLKATPVIVLTTSDRDEDVIRSYQLACRSYIRKPVDFDKFRSIIDSFGEYWLKSVKLPGKRNAG